MTKKEFCEVQQFRQIWFWALMIIVTVGVLGINVYAFHTQIIQDLPFGDNPMSNNALIGFIFGSTVILVAVMVLIYHSRLEIKIERYGISYRYPPFIRAWRFIAKENVKDWRVKSYLPSGYGIRPGFRFNTYNVSGNKGLELELNGMRNIRLGTQRPDELKEAMERLFNRAEI